MITEHSLRSISILVLFAVLFCAPQHAFSQTGSGAPEVMFSGLNTLLSGQRSYKQVLSSPAFECSKGYNIRVFSISFYSKKGNIYYGPFVIKGPKVDGEAMETLQKLNNDKVQPLRIFLDDIKIAGPDGTIRNMGSAFVDITN